jgi:hypothetical protein
MSFQGEPRQWPHGPHHTASEGNVWDETAVHDVDVDAICSSSFRSFYLFS